MRDYLRHQAERSPGKLDTIDEFSPIGQELVEVGSRHSGIIRSTDLGQALLSGLLG
jgi:hypothetical protein